MVRPSDLIGHSVVLQFWPVEWTNFSPAASENAAVKRSLDKAVEQKPWSAVLLVDRNIEASAKIRDTGEVAPLSSNPWGALGTNILNMFQSDQPSFEALSAV